MLNLRTLPESEMLLIDTWWNVNHKKRLCPDQQCVRFNRYMVECELVYHKSTFSDNKSFNRYMVECEYFFV